MALVKQQHAKLGSSLNPPHQLSTEDLSSTVKGLWARRLALSTSPDFLLLAQKPYKLSKGQDWEQIIPHGDTET